MGKWLEWCLGLVGLGPVKPGPTSRGADDAPCLYTLEGTKQRARREREQSEATLPAYPTAPEWTPDMQRTWAAFLASPAGQTLWARFRAVELDVSARAVKDSTTALPHTAGRAAGFSEARIYLESLSRSACATAETDTGAPDGEAQVRELYSP